MPTHRITFLHDCPETCDRYPYGCVECLKGQLEVSGIPFRDFQATLERGEEQELEGSRDIIYRKYLDVLNIKSVLVLDKSGICIYNHPVTGQEIDGNLVAGFIHANISFSREGVAPSFSMGGRQESETRPLEPTIVLDEGEIDTNPSQLYLLNYKDFVMMVHDGLLVRSVLIMDRQPSFSLKQTIVQFTTLFEKIYGEVLKNFSGDLSTFKDAHLVVERVFETDLLYPYTARIISPQEEQVLGALEKLVYRHGLDHVQKYGFFFVTSILEPMQESLQKPARDIVHAIYSLLQKGCFVPQDPEVAARYKQEQETILERMRQRTFSFDEIYGKTSEKEREALFDKIAYMTTKNGKELMKHYMNEAAKCLELGIYQDAIKNYRFAKLIAQGMNFYKDEDKISRKIDEIIEMMRQVEYDNAMRIAVAAEKNKDYLKAIKYYNTCRAILLDWFHLEPGSKRVLQIDKRIANLQAKVR